ncbi:primosomal protein N'' [Deinococcus peraridilitoris DSM 19664]|uniref:Probable replication restart protein PriA n=2 Tax=Deinococcus TaxID=1298 RepID=L0A3V9_DEIPD|nr:primosomal protein N'' [Deinococcus peraridilitoris DSM 19664]
MVPWQGELRVGIVLGPGKEAGHRLRDAVALLDSPAEAPWVGPAFLAALAEEARLSRVPLGLLLSDILPVGLSPRLCHRVRAVEDADLSPFGQQVPGPVWQDASAFDAALLDSVRAQGLLEEDLRPKARTVSVVRVSDREGGTPLTPKQKVAWAWLREQGHVESLSTWAQGAGVSTSVVTGVMTRGWAERAEHPAPLPVLTPTGEAPKLTLDRLPEAREWRLHGGRPAVRHRLLASRLARELDIGRSVIVAVPDHATLRRTWTALSGLSSEQRGRAVQLSGQLSEEEREHVWQLIRSGEARLVIGTCTALCAPVHDLATVVVKEEGSDAHKLLSGSHAFVPELARRLARHAECQLGWTGSVPSAEVLDVPGQVLPPPVARVHVVDYANPIQAPALGPLSRADLKPGAQGYPLSHDLQKVLRQVAERGRQAVLLAPRRGYSALLRCPSCEHTPMCRHCDVPLRFHQETRELTCHQCGYRERLHERCAECGERMWQARGPGTEWIAQEVRKLLPDFPVLRFDRDRQDDLSALQQGHSGVVIGTQALLTQDALPDLALIGVTLADTWLNVSDFRASERYHRLLRQLIEWHPVRAPLLVVQTFQAGHPALRCIVDGHDAGAYPAQERQGRQLLRYPPFARLAQIEVAARDQGKAHAAATAVAQALYGKGAVDGELLGPAPSPIARLRGVYPYHLLLRVRDDARLEVLLSALDRSFPGRVRVDVHPRGVFGA